MFDCEHQIALHAMQGNWDSFRRKGEVSWVFSSCGRNFSYILELRWGLTFETWVCSVKPGFMSNYDRHLRNLN